MEVLNSQWLDKKELGFAEIPSLAGLLWSLKQRVWVESLTPFLRLGIPAFPPLKRIENDNSRCWHPIYALSLRAVVLSLQLFLLYQNTDC